MSRYTQPILFDESIQQWRFRTKADDDYAKAIIKECFPEQKEPLQVSLARLAKQQIKEDK